MQEPLEIAFHNLEPSAALEADIRERFAKLEKLYDRMTSCRISVEALHKQHRTGNVFEVHIDMLVPGGELVVSKQPQKAKERFANPDVYVSVREAFKAAERQLLQYKRQLAGEVKQREPLFQGQVAEMHPDEDYGYLLTAEGASALLQSQRRAERRLRPVRARRRGPLHPERRRNRAHGGQGVARAGARSGQDGVSR